MRLYDYAASGNCFKIRLLLALLGRSYERVPVDIFASDTLTDEYAAIKVHPERGRELLSELGGFDESVKRLVLDHHERLDGTGYPRGLRGSDLDLPTRILAVCDVYDALVSTRVYRPAWTRDQALELLRSEADAGLDARCVTALERVLDAHSAERVPQAARQFVASPAR